MRFSRTCSEFRHNAKHIAGENFIGKISNIQNVLKDFEDAQRRCP
jgi:hypothetical protein